MLKIGIVGTGRIAKRFLIENEQVEESEVTIVFNPHIESAIRFSELNPKMKVANSLSELWAECDAVYIATPHETHAYYVEEALKNDKHVLCEKPMFLCEDDAKKYIELAQIKGKVLFEALKTKYCPGYKKLIEVARSGIIGKIVDVDACFTKLENTSHRELTDTKYGGSFRELGSYALLPIIDLLGVDYQNIYFNSLNGENYIDYFTRAFIKYKDAGGTIKVGLGAKSEGEMIISGTRGYIVVSAPWWKTTHFEVRYEDYTRKDTFDIEFMGDGLRYEITTFCKRVKDSFGYKLNDNYGIEKRAEIIGKFGKYHNDLKKRMTVDCICE